MTSIGRGIVFTFPIVLPLVGLVAGELVKHRSQSKTYANPGRNVFHACPQGKAQKQAYGDVACERSVFCFSVFHDSKTVVNG